MDADEDDSESRHWQWQWERLAKLSTEWMERAACAGLADQTNDAWFPPVGNAKAKTKMARRICASCPVRAECLNYAIEGRIEHGVWGGLTKGERRKVMRDRRGEQRSA